MASPKALYTNTTMKKTICMTSACTTWCIKWWICGWSYWLSTSSSTM